MNLNSPVPAVRAVLYVVVDGPLEQPRSAQQLTGPNPVVLKPSFAAAGLILPRLARARRNAAPVGQD